MHYWTPKIQDGGDPPSWKSTWRLISAEGVPIWIKFRRLVQNDMSTAVTWSTSKPEVEFQYGGRGRLGEFNGMSSQSHMPHCRVLPPGEFNDMSSQSHVSRCRVDLLPLDEFTVMITEPHATLQGAVTWRKQCHDRATLKGVRIPSSILKIVFRHILFIFVFLMQFGLWRAAAFVSSPIHLLILLILYWHLAMFSRLFSRSDIRRHFIRHRKQMKG